MNKYTALLQKYLKIILFLTLVLGLFFGFGQLFRASSLLKAGADQDPTPYKTAFFAAMQEQDLTRGRAAYEKLQTILPASDPFLQEVVPAYLADLYLNYAQSLSYDLSATKTMLDQAAKYSPNHPKLAVMRLALEREMELRFPTEILPEMVTAEAEPLIEVSEETLVPAVPEPKLAVQPREIPLSEQFPSVEVEQLYMEPEPELVAEVMDGPPRIPYIDPPPLPGTLEQLATQFQVPMTTDPCALSFYSREHALTPCIDPVGSNRYGPAMFVIGDQTNQPLLAFTQAAVTAQEYELYCELSKQCQEQAQLSEPLIDLKEVEDVVSDYNAYCQMTGTCPKLDAPNKHKTLSRGDVEHYAKWLSNQTGYVYRQAKEEDTQAILGYYEACIQTRACNPALRENLKAVLGQPERILVREIASR